MVIVSKNGQNFLYVGQKFLLFWSKFSIKEEGKGGVYFED